MERRQRHSGLRIGELARRAGTSADTVRYYERLGLLGASGRSENGYRLFDDADLGRLQFIRRAKLLRLSLSEICGFVGVAEKGHRRPLREQVAELLARKLGECEAQLAELSAFKMQLAERYRLALEPQGTSAGSCETFPADCGCLPVGSQEVTIPTTEPGSPHGRHAMVVRKRTPKEGGDS